MSPTNPVFLGCIAFVFFLCFMITCIQRDTARVDYQKVKSSLIDFGHARYVIDPVTGISKFEIDPSPNKTSK